MSSMQESTTELINFTGVGGSFGSPMFSLEVNLYPKSGVRYCSHSTLLPCNLHHDFRFYEPLQTSLVRYRNYLANCIGKHRVEYVLPGNSGRGSFFSSVWRKRIHTLFPLQVRVRAIRSIQSAHIGDHLMKLKVVLVKESRFLMPSCNRRTHGRDARRLTGLGGTLLFSSC